MPTKERGIANAKRGSRETNKPNPIKVSLSANTSGDGGQEGTHFKLDTHTDTQQSAAAQPNSSSNLNLD